MTSTALEVQGSLERSFTCSYPLERLPLRYLIDSATELDQKRSPVPSHRAPTPTGMMAILQGTRYAGQKRRLRLSGLKRLTYLLEGDPTIHQKATTGEDKSGMNRTVEVKTQAQVCEVFCWVDGLAGRRETCVQAPSTPAV